MKAHYDVEFLPKVAAYSSIYSGDVRRESNCSGCPFSEYMRSAGLKCKSTGVYSPHPETTGSACPYPTKPERILDHKGIFRPMCPEGSAVIDLRGIHWTRRAKLAGEDMENGCIPAWADRGGEPRPVYGYSIEVRPLTGDNSPWSIYRITWRKK